MKIKLVNEVPADPEADCIYISPDADGHAVIHVSGKDAIIKRTPSISEIGGVNTGPSKAKLYYLSGA